MLIAGDLFHRQPLLRELKEINYHFGKLSRTKVVLIAGNHDYIRKDSRYLQIAWSENVYPLFETTLHRAVIEELDLAVYGFSYDRREIREARYDEAYAPRDMKYEILLAHGGDETHIPIKKAKLKALGYDYVALGHIHKPQMLLKDYAAFSGSLEPLDQNETGRHGFLLGEITEKGTQIRFVPFAKKAVHTLASHSGYRNDTWGAAGKDQRGDRTKWHCGAVQNYFGRTERSGDCL